MLLIFIGYYLAHSFVWWQGMGGSLGLIRVIAGIAPLGALIALRGLNFILKKLKFKKKINFIIQSIISVLIILTVTVGYKLPKKYNKEEIEYKKVADWLQETGYINQKIYYYAPLIPFFLETDPYNKEKMQNWAINSQNPEKNIPLNSIVVWDAHYTANEGRIPLTILQDSPFYSEIKIFKPESAFTTLNNYNFEIHVFQKISNKPVLNLKKIFSKLNISNDSSSEIKILQFYDFDTYSFNIDKKSIKTNQNNPENNIYLLSNKDYHLSYKDTIKNIIEKESKYILQIDFELLTKKTISFDYLKLIVSIENNKKHYYYYSQDFSHFKLTQIDENHYSIKNEFIIDSIKSENDILKVYLWQKNEQKNIFIDNYLIYLKKND